MEMSLRAPLIWRALQLYKFASVLCVLWVILAAVTGPVLKHWKMDLKYCMVTPVQTVYFYDLHPFILGNDFDINVADLWSSSSPWPLCNMPKSYFFLVKKRYSSKNLMSLIKDVPQKKKTLKAGEHANSFKYTKIEASFFYTRPMGVFFSGEGGLRCTHNTNKA